ncbi:MAG: hypothetical protein KBT66_08975 [Amphritea sp.]|nr:hypothetical protein [Amphritea sp.]
MLDIRTLILLLCTIFLISAVMVFFSYRQHQKIEGPKQWAMGMALLAIGLLLMFARGHVPDFISIVISNGLMQTGAAILFLGIQIFLGFKPSFRLVILTLVILWIPFWLFYQDNQYLQLRIHTANFNYTLFFGASGFLLLNRYIKKRKNAFLITAVGFIFESLTALVRSVLTVLEHQANENFMTSGSTTSLFFFCVSAAHIVTTSGLLVLISERLQQNLEKALLREKLARKEQDNFWAMVSHEFKTPLGTIRNSIQLIENIEKQITPASMEAINRIHRASLRLSRLVDKTAIDQWINATSDKLRCIDFNLIETIKSLSFEYNIERLCINQNLTMHGDPLLLSTAISSLIDNALKYSDNRDACYIAAGINLEGKTYVDVYNDGKEVSFQEREHIFDRLYRSTERSAISGSGFGLYITKKIVELHDADIKMLSDNGTIFRITFNQGTKA